ncbi:Uncharacterized protein YLL007C [Sugiyamaella lignohabitans]|uniref:Uncharacterized protein YLL007C n=1 Tax=Sugiyamaella lignohabitans TaxID=796027 RepID=A0A167DUW7_9ASCO|nr:Uncharacterized protein YLL007C [Sugiyamaella lignohabitans]ANB13320.1 Uncharacterized protein YLL007C [Sugiyamaella lignohabitans]
MRSIEQILSGKDRIQTRVVYDLTNSLMLARKARICQGGNLKLKSHREIIFAIKTEHDKLVGPSDITPSGLLTAEGEGLKFFDEQSLLTFINLSGSWSSGLDIYELFHYDNLSLVKFYAQVSSLFPKERAFPLLRASIEVSNLLEEIFHESQFILPQNLADGTAITLIGTRYIKSKNKAAKELPTAPERDIDVFKGKFMNLYMNRRALHFWGVVTFMRMWKTSSACIEDIKIISTLVKCVFHRILEGAGTEPEIEDIICRINAITYQEAREYQMWSLQNELNAQWKKDTIVLQNKYVTESQGFVREKYIHLLLSGDVFMVCDPTTVQYSDSVEDFSSTNLKYLVAISPDKSTLRYKYLDDEKEVSVNSIDLSTIESVDVQQLAMPSYNDHPQNNFNTIKLTGNVSYAKITIMGKAQRPLLTFYSDTLKKAHVWRDGIMMAKDRDYQSDSSHKHAEMLAERKLLLQVLNLGPNDTHFSFESEPDIQSISTNFYYQ